jgi:DNA-binding GntR family transcriptional regulator
MTHETDAISHGKYLTLTHAEGTSTFESMTSLLSELTAPTLADQAYIAIREAIVDGELARGQKVTERGLASRLHVSPTPVREALRRLEQDQLIVRTGPRSMRVAELHETDAEQVSAIEDNLRGLAARLAARTATESQLAGMAAELAAADQIFDKLAEQPNPSDKAAAAAADRIFTHTRQFHAMLDQASNSPLLQRFLHMVEAFDASHRRRALRLQLTRGEIEQLKSRYPQHREIYDAVAARDEDRAESLMLKHVRESTPTQISAIEP